MLRSLLVFGLLLGSGCKKEEPDAAPPAETPVLTPKSGVQPAVAGGDAAVEALPDVEPATDAGESDADPDVMPDAEAPPTLSLATESLGAGSVRLVWDTAEASPYGTGTFTWLPYYGVGAALADAAAVKAAGIRLSADAIDGAAFVAFGLSSALPYRLYVVGDDGAGTLVLFASEIVELPAVAGDADFDNVYGAQDCQATIPAWYVLNEWADRRVDNLDDNCNGAQDESFVSIEAVPRPVLDGGPGLSLLTNHGASFAWTAATPGSTGSPVHHRLYYSTNPRMHTVAETLAFGTPVGAATTTTGPVALAGLSPATRYYLNVVARDEAGMAVVYERTAFDTLSACAASPCLSGATITVSSIDTHAVTLTWPGAIDAEGRPSSYEVYLSDVNDIGSLSTARANAIVQNTATAPTYQFANLAADTVYYVNVAALDGAQEPRLYTTLQITTDALVTDVDGDGYEPGLDCNDFDPEIHPGAVDKTGDGIDGDCDGTVDEPLVDLTAPTLADATLTPQYVHSTGLAVAWQPADDDVTSFYALVYELYYGTNPAMTTVAEIKANGDLVADPRHWLTGLGANGSYYFNVIVRDLSGRETAYAPLQVTLAQGGTDFDDDGWLAPFDCQPFATEIHPYAGEIIDNVDNDCNGVIDDL